MTATEDSPVVKKTIELCDVILAQPEFDGLRRRLDDFMADEVAQAAYRELSERGAALQELQHQGAIPNPDEVERFERQRQSFLDNPVAREFLEAQRTMHDVRETIDRYVTRTFELGRTPAAADFHSCGCGSGCGC
jgi:cell fate (sporulation/competence/biofilm development) regulator YlbF (YheA/YmcA/DUF963 family)